MRQCPRCASELNNKDKVCPRCRLPVSKMAETEEILAEDLEKQAESSKLNRAQKKEKKRLAKLAKKEARKQRKIEQSVSKTDFSQFAKNNKKTSDEEEILSRKRKKDEQFQFNIDENGKFNIDTKDVEIIGEEVGKIYEEKHQQTYSIKKARGDYRQPKLKWWEIYKIADRAFARRKIKKEVAKASKVKPDFISKGKLLALAVFLGWFGAHNFYAKNKKKGFVSLGFLSISFLGMMLNGVPFFKAIELWMIGFTGFIVLVIWISDIINIIFNKFQYRIQKDKFISGMNIETRAKLGEKYIDLELLKKPWWIRFKVWCEKKKRNYHEWRKDRRQALIEKEKEKLKRQEEKDKIESEISQFEQKELDNIQNSKSEEKTKRPARGSKNLQKASENISEEKQKESPRKRTAKITVNTKSKNNTKNNNKKK